MPVIHLFLHLCLAIRTDVLKFSTVASAGGSGAALHQVAFAKVIKLNLHSEISVEGLVILVEVLWAYHVSFKLQNIVVWNKCGIESKSKELALTPKSIVVFKDDHDIAREAKWCFLLWIIKGDFTLVLVISSLLLLDISVVVNTLIIFNSLAQVYFIENSRALLLACTRCAGHII